MSDYSIAFVPQKSIYPDASGKLREILNWLVSKDIVKPILSNCILSSSNGYAISDGARLITASPGDLPFGMVVNGLEIVTEREVFDTGENFIDELICPSCSEDIAFDDWDLTPWSKQTSDNLTCPKCGTETEIHTYSFYPEWGFSNLGFKFWNWPKFTDEFETEFRDKLGCDMSVVYQHL